jgi:hypothetical protein
MRKVLLQYVLLLTISISVSFLSAQNHMNVLTTMTGSFNGCGLGWSLASLDFNGDGIKDLVALEKNWNPNGTLDFTNGMFGRINFYWGRSNFDNTISANIPGTYQLQYGLGWIFNAGDVNGDGIEDLGYWGSENQLWKILIFYGRQQPNPTPDREYIYPNSQYYGLTRVYPLGDVDNDGYDDLGVSLKISNSANSIRAINGASNAVYDLYTVGGSIGSSINGIGDVNNDGIDDYHFVFPYYPFDSSQNRLSVHFGSSLFPVVDSLILITNTNSVINHEASPLGDINGDGIVDFASYMNASGIRIWYGSQNLTSQWNIIFPTMITSETDGYAIVHGDLNNDGFEDLISSNYLYAGQDGRAYVWMGGSNFNNTLDLTLYAPPGVAEKFGWAKAAGDFNNDGFCDAAISQPISDSGPETAQGRIHVYAGNAQLADTTVSNDDITIPVQDEALWKISVYPNPIRRGKIRLNICFDGEGYSKIEGNLNAVIYNIKGQEIDSYKIPMSDVRRKSWAHALKNYPVGEYLIAVLDKNNRLITHKLTIK